MYVLASFVDRSITDGPYMLTKHIDIVDRGLNSKRYIIDTLVESTVLCFLQE